jgi:hypothetical protein
MSKNANLRNAKKAKNDEFYTRYEDVEAEVMNYKDQLNGKIIYLPCDSEESAFWKFFVDNFATLGLKKVIATHYNESGDTYKLWTTGEGVQKEAL